MYGLGGSFGGNPYQSPVAAGLSGFEAGFALVRGEQDRAEMREQRLRENAREDRLDAVHQAQIDFNNRHTLVEEDRQRNETAYKMLMDQGKSLDAAMSATIQAAGGVDKVDPDSQAYFRDAVAQHQAKLDAVMGAIGGPFQQQDIGLQRSYQQRLNNGEVDPSAPGASADFYCHVANTGMNDPRHYLPGDDGSISKIGSDLASFNTGMQNGDQSAVLAGVRGVCGNQFNTHLGGLNPLGGTVTQRNIVGAVPTPDGSALHPVVAVGADHYDGATSTVPYGPRTDDGSDHPDNQTLASLDWRSVMDHMGMQGVLNAAVGSSPQAQDMIKQHMDNPPQRALDFAHTVAMRGINANPTAWKPFEGRDGSVTYVEHDMNGMPTGRKQLVIEGNKPERAQTETSMKEAAARRLVGQINPDTGEPYTEADVDRAILHMDKSQPVPITESDKQDMKNDIAGDLGLAYDKDAGIYKKDDGTGVPDWRTLKMMRAAHTYVDQVLTQSKANRKPVDMQQVRAVALQKAQLAVRDAPDLEVGTVYHRQRPDPKDPTRMVDFSGRYKGGDPDNDSNFSDVVVKPIETSPDVVPQPTPSRGLAASGAAGSGQRPTARTGLAGQREAVAAGDGGD